MSKQISYPPNRTNPRVLEATGYGPWFIKRTNEGLKSSDPAVKDRYAKLQHYWNQERNWADMEKYNAQHAKQLFRSQWECSAEKKGLNSLVNWELNKIKEKFAFDLRDRRNRLKKQLDNEQKMFVKEMSELEETATDKEYSMLDRYKKLLEQKEKERQKVVREKRDQQFKLNCDELRAEISKKIQCQTSEEGRKIAFLRDKTIEEKELEAKFFAEANLRDAEAKETRVREMEQLQKERGRQCGTDLLDQMQGKNFPPSLSHRSENEAKLMREQKRLMELEKEWELAEKRQKQEKLKNDLDSCVRNKFKQKAQDHLESLSIDYYFLDQLMRDDTAKQEAAAKKHALNKEQREYMDYLRREIWKASELEKTVEKLQNEENDRMWEKQEKQWEAEKQRRSKMNKRMIELCKEQVRAKEEQGRITQELKMKYDEEIKRQVELSKKFDADKQRERLEKNIAHQEEILEQINLRQIALNELREQNMREAQEYKKQYFDYEKKIKETVAESKIGNLHPWRK